MTENKKEEITQEGLGNFLTSLLGGIERENVERYKKSGVIIPELLNEGTEEFHRQVTGKLERYVDAFFEEKGLSHDVNFLFQHHDYVESNLRWAITKFEGYPCSADKTRYVHERALRYYMNGEEIPLVNGDKEYWIPTIIFKTTEQVTNYIKALQQQYYGNPMPLAEQILAVTERYKEYQENKNKK